MAWPPLVPDAPPAGSVAPPLAPPTPPALAAAGRSDAIELAQLQEAIDASLASDYGRRGPQHWPPGARAGAAD
eukprot:12010919-Alexandrium_andersonii.AAC.1